MSLLLNESEAAANDVLLRLEEAADHYRDVADTTASDHLRKLAQKCHQSCQDNIEEFVAYIREQGQLPRQPDSEREFIEHGLARLGASIAPDENSALREALLQREQRLCDAIEVARAQELPDAGVCVLRGLSEASTERRQQLQREH